jgi:ABC-type lipoprotein export system ATPase subunit
MIHFLNVRKSYPNPSDQTMVPILDIPSFEIKPGQHVGLRGPSGCGKTTLLHLISGMILPDSGAITVNGQQISSLSEAKRDRFRANHIGYIFQSFNLLDGFSALENVMLGMIFADKGSRKEEAIKLLTEVGLEDRLHYKPSQLSVGQQQRVCIARAIANNPEIILADEPTGSLDPKNSREILELLINVCKDRVLLVVSHEEEVLQRFSNTQNLQEINKAALV